MESFLKLKKMIRSKGLFLVLVLQMLCLIYVGMQKEGMHIDEKYSFILSNSYETDRISNATEIWNTWIGGEEFEEFMSVNEGEQFAYDRAYYNNTLDAHPPFFYFVLHTVCSFFPGQFTMWFGLGMNIVLILLTQVVLYVFAKEIMRDSLWALVPVAIYGGTQAFFDTAIFIRMYALLSLLAVLLVRQHWHLMKDTKIKKNYLLCFLITFMGTFTHYYFAFVAFFLAAVTCVWMMIKRNWKSLFAYGGLMLFAIICVFIVYPAGISQITGTETNNVGKEVMSNLFDFSGWLHSILSMSKQIIINAFSGYFYGIIAVGIVIVITIVALCLSNNKNKATDTRKTASIVNIKHIIALAIVLIGTIVIISHVSGAFVYVRYVYNLFPLFSLFVGVVIWMVADVIKANREILAMGIIVVGIIGAISFAQSNLCSYLLIEDASYDNTLIQDFEGKPVVLVNKGYTYQPTGLINILMECDQLYLADYIQKDDVDSIFSQVDCSNGVVFIVLTDTYWADGFQGDEVMQAVVEETDFFDSYYTYGNVDFSTIYIAETHK